MKLYDIDANLMCAQHSKSLQSRTLKAQEQACLATWSFQNFHDAGFTLVEVNTIHFNALWWKPASAACAGACCSRCIEELACGEAFPGCVIGWVALV